MEMNREQYFDIVNIAMGSLHNKFSPVHIGQIINALMNAYDYKVNEKTDINVTDGAKQ